MAWPISGCGQAAGDDARPAAARWTPPQQLNAGTIVDGGEIAPFASEPRVAIDARGAAVVVYATRNARGDDNDVFVATAPPGETFGPPRVLIANADVPQVAAQPDGSVLVAALRSTKRGVRTTVVAGRTDGTFGRPRTYRGFAVSALAVVPGGRTVAFREHHRRDGPTTTSALELAADGSVATRLRVDPGSISQGTEVAAGADGTLAIPQSGGSVVVRSASGHWRRFPTGIRGLMAQQAAVAPDGKVGLVGIAPRLVGEASSYGRVVAAELSRGDSRFRRLPVPPVVPRRAPTAIEPSIAYDDRGRRVISWIEDTTPDVFSEVETPAGRAIAVSPDRRTALDARARFVRLTGLASGVLAVSDGGTWSSALLSDAGTVRLAGPKGRATGAAFGTEYAIARSPRRVVLAWRGAPDGGVRTAFLSR